MSGLPEKLYTANQVRRLDACAIDQHGIPGYELMNRAAGAVLEAAIERYPNARQWTVICGAGNNAGDGYALARLAAEQGIKVHVYAVSSPEQLKGDAQTAASDWLQMDGTINAWPAQSNAATPDLIIDALLGTGIDRPVEGSYREAIDWMNAQSCPGVAVDIPSGLNADTGQIMAAAFRASVTISFIGLKRGLIMADGPDYSGQVVFDSLDIPDQVYDSVDNSGFIIRENYLARALPGRRRNTHKGNYGHVLIVGGNHGMSGAVQLAGTAALRSGAGLVSIATHPVHAATLNLARPELMVSSTAGAEDLLPLIERANVIAVGPGFGKDKWARNLLKSCLDANLPMVIDADGLNLLAENPTQLQRCILTPHPAEAANLLGIETDDVQSDRVAAAFALAEKFNSVVILKGCGTVVADPGGSYAVCPLGNPGMATAGSGDVLTGVVAAFLAQGLGPEVAARAGVVAHAGAGDYSAATKGEYGLLAGDIIDGLPGLMS